MKNTDIELWRPVLGFEGRYEVSDLGRVRSLDRRVSVTRGSKMHTKFYPGRELAQIPHPKDPYLRVWLCLDGEIYPRTVHSLVAAAFRGPRPVTLEVCHADGDGSNNSLANLRYASRAENREDSRRLDLLAVGEMIVQSKLTAAQVAHIRTSGMSAREVETAYPVKARQARRVIAGEAWRHV